MKLKKAILTCVMIGCYSPEFLAAKDNPRNVYDGCLVFIDDYRGLPHEKDLIDQLKPNILLRSWYRWGEPDAEKDYMIRRPIVEELSKEHISLGGGCSLSILNDLDIGDPEFDDNWFSRHMDGSIYEVNGQKYGTLSAPGFRFYLIGKMLQQALLGVKELCLGETTGEIHYDDWTLGISGEHGFIQWLREKYRDRDRLWWEHYLGQLGYKIFNKDQITRADFIQLSSDKEKNFRQEWGLEGSWQGRNESGEPAFLSYLYSANLNAFITELRNALRLSGYDGIAIDVWGTADWIAELENKPDGIIERFPGKEWGLDWGTNLNYSFERGTIRLEDIVKSAAARMRPLPVVWAIDHPEPYETFKMLPDEMQAQLIQNMAELCWKTGCNFLIRSYSEDLIHCGPITQKTLIRLCHKARKYRIPR